MRPPTIEADAAASRRASVARTCQRCLRRAICAADGRAITGDLRDSRRTTPMHRRLMLALAPGRPGREHLRLCPARPAPVLAAARCAHDPRRPRRA
jgi:hypothetical protein